MQLNSKTDDAVLAFTLRFLYFILMPFQYCIAEWKYPRRLPKVCWVSDFMALSQILVSLQFFLQISCQPFVNSSGPINLRVFRYHLSRRKFMNHLKTMNDDICSAFPQEDV